MKTRLKNTLIQILKIALAVGLLYYLFTSGKVDLESLKRLFMQPTSLLVGLLSTGLILFLASERWRVLLNQQGLDAKCIETYKLSLIGTFFNFFVPGGVGGDVVKAVLLAQNHIERRGAAVLTVLADRVLGLFTMTLLALVSFVFEPLLLKESSFQIIFAGLLLLTLAFLVAFWILLGRASRPLRDRIDGILIRSRRLHKLWVLAQTYRLNQGQILKLFGLSLLAQLAQIFLFVALASQIVDQVPPLSVFLFAVPVGFMVTAVPIAPAGIGIGQAAFLYLFSKALGTETDLGVLGVTAFQAFQLCYGLLGAVFFVVLKRQNPSITMEELEKEQEKLEDSDSSSSYSRP